MFKLWCHTVDYKGHTLCDEVITVNENINRTKKVLKGLSEACDHFDLSQPIWLDQNIKEFKSHSKTRFTQDSFVESIDFNYLEIQVLEEN